MSAAHYMVSIKTDMPKNPRPEDLNVSVDGTVAKKKKPSVPEGVSGYVQYAMLCRLEAAATNVTNKKERFDEFVLKLAHDYTTEPLKSEKEKAQETRVIKWIANYLNAILELMEGTKKFIFLRSDQKLPKQFTRDLPEHSDAQMRKWAISQLDDEDHELSDEAQFIADEDDEIDMEYDEEDELAIDATKRGEDGEILPSFNNFKILVMKLIRELNEEGEDIPDDELEFLSNVVKKHVRFYRTSLVKMLRDPVIESCIQKLQKSRGLKSIIETLVSIWNEDEYLLQLLEDLEIWTEDTPLGDARFLIETKKKLEHERIASIAKKKMEKALTAKNVERGLTATELERQIEARKELQELGEQNGISSREAQPEVTGDGNRRSSRLRNPIERLRGDHFVVPAVNLDTGIRNIHIRINHLRQMKHFLNHVTVSGESAGVKKMKDELIPTWQREVTQMIEWGHARIQSREQRYKREAQLLQVQIKKRSALQYKYNETRFFLFHRHKHGDWEDISGKAEKPGHHVSLLFDSWHEASIENPKLTMDNDSGNVMGLVISIPRDNLEAMGLVIPGEKKTHVEKGYSITNCPIDAHKCLMIIDDPTLYQVQRISELYVTGIRELNALKVVIPEGYEVKVGNGYEVWKSHRKPKRYWIRILNPHCFNSRCLKQLDCRGLNSEITSPDDSGDEEDNPHEEDNPLLPAELVIKKLESIAVQRGLSDEQIKALEDLKRKWTAQRQPPPEDPDVERFVRYRSPKYEPARHIKEWKEYCRRKGLGKQYLNVVGEILKKHGSPGLVLEDNGIGSDQDGPYFIPDWKSPRAGPALESFLTVLENEQAQAYFELCSLEEKKRLEIEALEDDEYEASEASAFPMEIQKVDAQLETIECSIKMLEGKGILSSNDSESLRQLTMERDELVQLERIIRNQHNAYRRKRKQCHDEERQDLHDQRILRQELERQHREAAEEEMILRLQDVAEERDKRRTLLQRHQQMFSNADRSEFQGESLVRSGESGSSVVSSITERLKNFERERDMRMTAAKEKAGAAGASGKSRDNFPNKVGGMFSQKLDKDLNDVHLCFLSLEP